MAVRRLLFLNCFYSAAGRRYRPDCARSAIWRLNTGRSPISTRCTRLVFTACAEPVSPSATGSWTGSMSSREPWQKVSALSVIAAGDPPRSATRSAPRPRALSSRRPCRRQWQCRYAKHRASEAIGGRADCALAAGRQDVLRALREAGIPLMASQSHIIPVPVGDPVRCREASTLLLERFAPMSSRSTIQPCRGVPVAPPFTDVIPQRSADRRTCECVAGRLGHAGTATTNQCDFNIERAAVAARRLIEDRGRRSGRDRVSG